MKHDNHCEMKECDGWCNCEERRALSCRLNELVSRMERTQLEELMVALLARRSVDGGAMREFDAMKLYDYEQDVAALLDATNDMVTFTGEN